MPVKKRYNVTPSDILELEEPGSGYNPQLIDAARKGVKRKDFLNFVKHIKRSVQSLSDIIPASYSSLSKKQHFDLETSTRIYEIAQIYAIGREVFGDIDRFNDWLNSVSIPLGGITPFSLLDTSFGFDLVRKELSRIDHGVFP